MTRREILAHVQYTQCHDLQWRKCNLVAKFRARMKTYQRSHARKEEMYVCKYIYIYIYSFFSYYSDKMMDFLLISLS